MPTLTPRQKTLLVDILGWVLDQDHDARGMGDPDYLYFLTDDEAGETTEALVPLLEDLHTKALALPAWNVDHAETCPVTHYRADLLWRLALSPEDAPLKGAVPEYDNGGDQEVELCECGRYPVQPGWLYDK